MIGQTISHYKITGKLGAGGMGEVFLAEDTALSRRVALKFLPDSLCGVEEARQRFLREAQAAAALNHQNIVTIYEVAEHDGRPFFAMEHVDGKSLRDYCTEGKRTLDQLLGLAEQIGEGLEKAHRAGIIHRDLKPGNILINADGNAKIVDFGLAQVRGAARLTQTGSTLGTASYMSPEQAQGLPVDHRSDIFSFGAVVYEMLAGQAAFAGEHDAAIVYAIVHEDPAPLARYRPDIPDDIARLVSRCMAKEPEDRYQSAADLVADLRRLRRVSDSRSVPVVEPASKRKMLAVLPFENLGPAEDEYFADGITEEIISRLASVKELGVISRTSVMQYKGTRKAMREIGAELGADHILEGTVRWGKSKGGGSRVRITPQLIKVADDTHLWSDRYDRELEDIFDVQSEIAEQVIEQLNVTLVAPERAAINVRPTDNLDAYNAFLRGKEYANRPSYLRRNFDLALQMFMRAVELDPKFALAWAGIGLAHSNIYHHGYDRTDDRKAQAEQTVARAIELQPDAAEVRLARGLFLYRCYNDYDGALEEFEVASASAPNSSELWMYIGAVRRRRGEIVEGLESFKRAFELDPLSSTLPSEIGATLTLLHRFEEADQYFQRIIATAPDQVLAYLFRCDNYLSWKGDLEAARNTLEKLPRETSDDANLLFLNHRQLLFERRFAEALKLIGSTRLEMLVTQMGVGPKSLIRAQALFFLGREDEAREAYHNALRLLEEAIKEYKGDFRYHIALGRTYAGLGRKDNAIASGLRATELMPVTRDVMHGTMTVYDLAGIYASVNEPDRACELLGQILSKPSWFTRKYIQLDPLFDPLHGHPRYEALMAQEETVF
jgi:serine/threonine protein kinase/tetratricopeptide (TPR) repeat protein